MSSRPIGTPADRQRSAGREIVPADAVNPPPSHKENRKPQAIGLEDAVKAHNAATARLKTTTIDTFELLANIDREIATSSERPPAENEKELRVDDKGRITVGRLSADEGLAVCERRVNGKTSSVEMRGNFTDLCALAAVSAEEKCTAASKMDHVSSSFNGVATDVEYQVSPDAAIQLRFEESSSSFRASSSSGLGVVACSQKVEGNGTVVTLKHESTLFSSSETTLTCSFDDRGRLNGPCKVRLCTGDQFEGTFTDGRPSGEASFSCDRGERCQFRGTWKDGMRHGHGTFQTTSGRKFVGEWNADSRHGQGTLEFPFVESGSTTVAKVKGSWHDGRLSGPFTIEAHDKTYACDSDALTVTIPMSSGVFRGKWQKQPQLFLQHGNNEISLPSSSDPVATIETVQVILSAMCCVLNIQSALKLQAGPVAMRREVSTLLRMVAGEALKRRMNSAEESLKAVVAETEARAQDAERLTTRLRKLGDGVKKSAAEVDRLGSEAKVKDQLLEEAKQEEQKELKTTATLESKLADLPELPSSTEADSTELSNELRSLSKALAEKSTEGRQIKTKVESAKRELSATKEEVSHLTDHLNKCNEAMTTAETKLEQQRVEYDRLISEAEESKQKVYEHVDTLLATVERLDAENSRLRQDVEAMSTKRQGKERSAAEKQEHLSRRQKEVAELHRAAAEVLKRVDELKDRLASLESETETLQQAISSEDENLLEEQKMAAELRKKLGAAQQKETALKCALEKGRNEAASSEEELEHIRQRMERSIANLKKRCSAVDEEIAEANTTSETTSSRRSFAESSDSPADRKSTPEAPQTSKTQQELNRTLQEIQQVRAQRTQLSSKMASSQATLSKLQDRIAKLQASKRGETLSTEIEQYKSMQTSELKELIASFKQGNEKEEMELSALKRDLQARQSEVDKARRELASNSRRGLPSRGSSNSVDPRLKILQEEADRRDSRIAELRMQVKRVQHLESKLAAARDTAHGLSQSRHVRQQHSSALKRRDTLPW